MTEKNKSVMVAGHICLDITPKFPDSLSGGFNDIFAPGKLINVGEAVIGTGGAVSNTGLAMAKLGLDVKLNGRIGDDAFGEMIRDIVGRDRSKSFSIVHGQSSSYSIVIAPPGQDRMFLHNPATNDTFTLDDIDYDALKGCRLFHFGYPPLMRRMYQDCGSQTAKMFQKAKDCGVITSLDMTLPDPDSDSGRIDWRQMLKNTLPHVDIFLPSVEETAFMLDKELFYQRKQDAGDSDPVLAYSAADCEYLTGTLIDMGVSIAAIKKGIDGYYLQTAEKIDIDGIDSAAWQSRQIWCPSYFCPKEEFASATGAGDTTIAGFLTSILYGLEPVETLRTANILAYQNIRSMDTLSGIKDWETTIKMARDTELEFNKITIDEDGWRFDENTNMWYGPRNRNSAG
jgi:sugar/nucleoside kinase (ribokinase family)